MKKFSSLVALFGISFGVANAEVKPFVQVDAVHSNNDYFLSGTGFPTKSQYLQNSGARLTVGADTNVGHVVLGGEVFAGWQNSSLGYKGEDVTIRISSDQRYGALLKGGYNFNEHFGAFLKAGATYIPLQLRINGNTKTSNEIYPTVGAGLEGAIYKNLKLVMEYRIMQGSGTKVRLVSGGDRMGLRANIRELSLGLKYGF
jgi:opacity protein-like surface antigen